jgi:hypothetical protein
MLARRDMPAPDPLEEHYTLKEIGKLWKVDEETARKAFLDVGGVLIMGDQDRHDGKRAYLTIRVPKSVLEYVYRLRTTRRFHAPRNSETAAGLEIKGLEESLVPRRARRRTQDTQDDSAAIKASSQPAAKRKRRSK